MKRYYVQVEGEEYVVEIKDDEIYINGVLAEESFFSALNDQGLYLIQAGEQKEEIHIQRETQTDFRITVDGHHLTAQIEQDTGRKNRNKKSAGSNDGEISAPMPGLIVDISVSEGENVEAEQTLFVLEAMKMQMKIKAPATGVVQQIHYQSGDRVEKGDLILTIQSSN